MLQEIIKGIELNEAERKKLAESIVSIRVGAEKKK